MTTSLPRLAPLEPPYAADVADDLARLMPPGVPPIALFRTVAHNPRVLSRFRRGGLLDPGSITLREREIAVLRTTARCRAEYEWGVHVAFFSGAAGLTEAEIRATVHGDAADPVWSPREGLIVALCDALHDRATVCDALWAALAAELSPAQIVELVVLAGQYHMVSFVTNALGVPAEPGAARFPA
jgi:4-carboxymuconolactone decarboxylase